jgi:MATE family multidrug resistance protein
MPGCFLHRVFCSPLCLGLCHNGISLQIYLEKLMHMSLFREVKTALKLAIPMAATQLAQIALGVTDTLMCGRLGGHALAAVGLGTSAFAMLWLPVMGIIQAIGPLVAQAHGAGDREAIRRYVHHGLALAFMLGLVGVFLLGFAAPILSLLNQPPELIDLAESYILAVRWGLIPALMATVLRGFLDSLSRPRPGLIIALFGIVINVVANWGLMFGHWGLPALGVAGTGWASSSVNIFTFLTLLLYTWWEPELRPYHIWKGPFVLLASAWSEFLRVGLPMAGGIMAEVWLFTGMAFLMGQFGASAVAAHQVSLNVASTTFMVALGIANASTVRVGQAMGRGEPLAARLAGRVGMGLGVTVMGSMGLVLWFAPTTILGLYLDLQDPANAPVIALGSQFLKLAALFQLFDALQVTSQGALRGLKDTRTPMLIGFACYWGVGLGSAVLLAFGLGWRETGLWCGLILGLMAAAIALNTRFHWHFRKHRILLEQA